MGGEISRLPETVAKIAKALKGRQALILVFNHYKVDEENSAMLGLADLLSVEFRDDSHLETFLSHWDNVLCSVREQLPDRTLETLFVRQVRQSKVLAPELAHYERAPPNSADRSYLFL